MPRIATRRKQGLKEKQPHIFGRGGRDRVLICLALNGAMHVRAIARAIGSDSHKTFDMVENLCTAGLVVKRNHEGGRKYAALNQRLPFYQQLRGLLLALHQFYPKIPTVERTSRWYMPYDDVVTPYRTDRFFNSPIRSRVLLFVAAVGTANMENINKPLGIGSVSAIYAVNHWERQGVTRSALYRRHRLVSLNPDFSAAKEMRVLLLAILRANDEYDGLGEAVKERMVRKEERWKKPLRKRKSS